MDPMTLIVTALVAGAAAAGKDVAAQVVKDGYSGLKALMVRKLGEKGNVAGALAGVEKKPDSESWQAALKEELETTGAVQDTELVQRAQALLDLLKEHGQAPGVSYHAELRGRGAIAQGEGTAAAGAEGVAVGRDVHGPVVTGHGNVVGRGQSTVRTERNQEGFP